MHLPAFIAGRYLFAKKSHSAISIISAVSVAGVGVVTAAMIIVLSVFNGFEGLVISLYSAFEPPLRVTPALGKVMAMDTVPMDAILMMPGVSGAVETLEESCLLRYRDRQYFARVKGVSDNFRTLTGIDTLMSSGTAELRTGTEPRLLLGGGVAYHLEAGVSDPFNPIGIYVPRRGLRMGMDPSRAFQVGQVFPAGVFSIQQDFDTEYVLAPLSFVRELLERGDAVSALEVHLSGQRNMAEVRGRLRELLGPGYVVKDRFEQNELLYTIMKTEKWAVFLILAFILMVSIFNVTGSLTMLILDKRKDINVLRSLGADEPMLRGVFLLEGMMIAMLGALGGLALGLLVCWAQVRWGIVPMNTSGNYVVQAYPVMVQPLDVLYVLLTVASIAFLAAWLPVRKLIRPEPRLRMAYE